MIAIYHIESRRSERIVWLLEELGVDYELKFVPEDLAIALQRAECRESRRSCSREKLARARWSCRSGKPRILR